MKKGPKQTTIALPPEEWDFRPILQPLLHLAILYEYAREVPWVVERFAGWHRQRTPLAGRSAELRTWIGLTVGQVLKRALEAEPPVEVWNALMATYPDWLYEPPFDQIAEISIHFPVPFLRLPSVDPGLLGHLDPKARLKFSGFRILSTSPVIPDVQRVRLAEMGIYSVPVQCDLRVGKTKFKKDAAAAADKFFEEHSGGRFNLPTGAQAAVPFSHLRELAAYRLGKSGLGWDRAQKLLEVYRKRHPVATEAELLPTYASSGAWTDACNAAAARIHQLYPAPPSEGR